MTQETPLPLDHTPAPPPASPLLMVVSGILSLLLWLAVVGQLVFLVPSVTRLSGEFRMKLPLVTEWVIHGSQWAVPTIAVAALLVCIGLGRRSPWPWLFLLLLLPLVLNVLVGVSLCLPYMELLEGLSGTSKK